MKHLMLLAALIALNSCNTTLGMYRDAKHGYEWTKEKIQGSGANDSGDPSGAPVY